MTFTTDVTFIKSWTVNKEKLLNFIHIFSFMHLENHSISFIILQQMFGKTISK